MSKNSPLNSAAWFRLLPIRALTVAMLGLCHLGAAQAFEQEADPADLTPASRNSAQATGRAHFDLPLGVRAYIESTYTNALYVSDKLARPYVANEGPNLRRDHSLESQFALTRSIAPRLEIGIVWGTRNRLSGIELFDFDRQTIGAIIRLAQ